MCEPSKYFFNLSVEKGVFPDDLKIARVTSIYKGEDSSNCRVVSVLQCFSKILERILYNRLYKYLIENNISYSKQFGFQNGHSTDHAVVQLADQIIESFENNKYTLGVFIDLSKAFDSVDHSILLKKLEIYGITERNHGWVKSVGQISEKEKTTLETISCGVPQGSILGPHLFLLYVNNLKNTSNILDPIMFADDTNLLFIHKDIRYLFQTINQEFENINQWFISNKLSLNMKKQKLVFPQTESKGKHYTSFIKTDNKQLRNRTNRIN